MLINVMLIKKDALIKN